ncbi:MAG: hypothetical protein AW12_02280 [Candidatus Accumulibacter sp. BA-94]|nr:MAG: hypothetical protein AW12_02280 [Candidatus Accumulibacter sp. BA-94]
MRQHRNNSRLRLIMIIRELNNDGAGRARRKACATTVAAQGVEQRRRNSANAGHESDGAGHALIAADPAFDLLNGQAALTDGRARRPWDLPGQALQCATAAGVDTSAAECAFADRKIDDRVAAVAIADDSCWTDRLAIATTATGLPKSVFGDCPGWPQGRRAGRKSATQKIPAASGVGHGVSPASSAAR